MHYISYRTLSSLYELDFRLTLIGLRLKFGVLSFSFSRDMERFLLTLRDGDLRWAPKLLTLVGLFLLELGEDSFVFLLCDNLPQTCSYDKFVCSSLTPSLFSSSKSSRDGGWFGLISWSWNREKIYAPGPKALHPTVRTNHRRHRYDSLLVTSCCYMNLYCRWPQQSILLHLFVRHEQFLLS